MAGDGLVGVEIAGEDAGADADPEPAGAHAATVSTRTVAIPIAMTRMSSDTAHRPDRFRPPGRHPKGSLVLLPIRGNKVS